MRFSLTPCRVSFVLCALLALFMDYEHAADIRIADPPAIVGWDPEEAPA